MDIDMVYLWVDGSDPQWLARRAALEGRTVTSSPATTAGEDCKGRYADNDELRFSLRSVALYAPWIRRIHIVTDRQTPRWLDTSDPRIHIVDHSEIMPPESIPCFNSNAIEHCLGRIPDLAEHFIYANDDMFINRPVLPADFFTPEGLPVIRLNRRPFRRLTLWLRTRVLGRQLSHYNLITHRTATLVADRLGHYFGDKMHHNIDAYRRSDFIAAEEMFADIISPTMTNHFRRPDDIQRCLHSYVPLALGQGKAEYVDRSTSFHLHIDNPAHYAKLQRMNPMLFCLNDSEYATDEHRRMARAFIAARFPSPSPFELPV